MVTRFKNKFMVSSIAIKLVCMLFLQYNYGFFMEA